jgi:RimJ/RimL family protein N-acetyltransferase
LGCAQRAVVELTGAGEADRAVPLEQYRPRVTLREVEERDLELFFHHQLDAEASAIAAFPPRGREEHFEHWHGILSNRDVVARTIALDDHVAGNIVTWVDDDGREVGYWIAKPTGGGA